MSTRTYRFAALAGTVMALSYASSSTAAPLYSLVDLGTLGGITSKAYGINASGQVVGSSTIENNDNHAFVYSGGTMQDLGTLGGMGSNSRAFGINASGQVTGASNSTYGNRAFLYSSGTMQDLSTFMPGYPGATSAGRGINASGQVVGNSYTYFSHAVLFSAGTTRDLGTLGGSYGIANDINDHEQIVGTSTTANNRLHAFLYSDGAMHDLGTLGGTVSSASGINDSGQIVGGADTGAIVGGGNIAVSHAFLYSDGVMQDLGTLGGWNSNAADINASGQVVGTSDTENYGPHAFLYADGAMHDLNFLLASEVLASEWRIYEASAINDVGQVAAYGCRTNGSGCRALRLDPVAPVPLPAAAWLFMTSLGAMGGIAKRRRTAAGT